MTISRQIEYLTKRLENLRAQSDRWSWLRLGVILVGALVVFPLAILAGITLTLLWLVLVLIVFGLVVQRHRRIQEMMRQLEIWRAIKGYHLARLNLDWDNLPPAVFSPDPSHPFENDFDVTGPYSLHRLVDTTTTTAGAQYLREWLLTTVPNLKATLQRQAVIRELQQRRLFRDKLTLYATRSARRLDRKRDLQPLLNWLEGQSTDTDFRRLLYIAIGFLATNYVLFILNIMGLLPAFWQLTGFLYLSFIFSRLEIRGFFGDVLKLQSTLMPLRGVFEHIETTPYPNAPHLKAMCAPILATTLPPSSLLRRVNRILGAAGLQQNGIAWAVVNFLVPWDLYFAAQLQETKKMLKNELPCWLDTWAQLEALSALANFADLHPEAHFPQFKTHVDAPVMQATGLGHPLIPAPVRVANDFTIEDIGDIALLTGSNMSGKSTFLRTVGLNMALGFAGAPVIAQSLETVPFRLFACIRVTDSVTDGISYFYAEVKRLKALLVTLQTEHDYPLLYLIDEIFRGTNNRERLIGSRSYIEALVGTRGTGIIATHDLELVQLADEFTEIDNYHFRDDVRDGKMMFDYQLHAGPSPTTNALKIMKMEGLPVDS